MTDRPKTQMFTQNSRFLRFASDLLLKLPALGGFSQKTADSHRKPQILRRLGSVTLGSSLRGRRGPGVEKERGEESLTKDLSKAAPSPGTFSAKIVLEGYVFLPTYDLHPSMSWPNWSLRWRPQAFAPCG